MGVSFHVHLLDGPEKPDGTQRSGHIVFARGDLFDESAAAKRDACSGFAADYVCKFQHGLAGKSRQFCAMDRQSFRGVSQHSQSLQAAPCVLMLGAAKTKTHSAIAIASCSLRTSGWTARRRLELLDAADDPCR